MTPARASDLVEFWGIVVLISAAVLEAVLVVQRRLAARYGWRRWPTISMVFRDDGKQWLVFPFGWGVLPGHWWGPWPRLHELDWIVLAAAITGFLARDIANRWNPTPVGKVGTFVTLLLGVFVGALFWSTGA